MATTLLAPGVALGELDGNPLAMPEVGDHQLRVISPTLLELTLVGLKPADPLGVSDWDLVNEGYEFQAPAPSEFEVHVGEQLLNVEAIGFKRRALYAPLKTRDLRVVSSIYLKLGTRIQEGSTVEVKNPSGLLWQPEKIWRAVMDPVRLSPAIHVNQVGYAPGHPKKALFGYYLGDLGELEIPAEDGFRIIDAESGEVVLEGPLTRRPDSGYTYSPAPYQNVYEADFSNLEARGTYRLQVPGLGVSFPIQVHDGAPAALARAFASGLYHQRCGTKNELPFTRHVHDECHTAPAAVPTSASSAVNAMIASVTWDYSKMPRHTAVQLKDVDASLYPFLNSGQVNVSGGHHDAGDYSKYTINCASLVHHLVFAADALPGAGALDNLGIPESGDGKSDLLQETKWAADFLARLQDADGGFYFLVYPRERRYEDDVLPDRGDPQVVWPKNTAATAAAVAALAEAGSSPLMKQQFPAEAALYLEKAQLGWQFLERALARHGKDGSYQKLTHYGNEFIHDDELAWAAAAMYAATGSPAYQQKLMEWYDPADPNTLRWGWWRLFEGYGCATRTYAFAARTGRLPATALDVGYLEKCDAELIRAADEHVENARQNAYGTSFPRKSKEHGSAGWYFSSERAFDVAVAQQIRPKPEYLETILSNGAYESGCNPLNLSYITGLGWKRQREIVHQYAQNDHRTLPPSGLPIGNVQAGPHRLYNYGWEMTALTYPYDGATWAPYPFYDRWTDTFNMATEFVIVDQARSLATWAYMMAQSSLRDQPWRAATAQIVGLPASVPSEQKITVSLESGEVDLTHATVTWEARDQQPAFGRTFTFAAVEPGEQWVEAEAQLPDGRRIFAVKSFSASVSTSMPPNPSRSEPVEPGEETVALLHLDDLSEATEKHGPVVLRGNASLDDSNIGWMLHRSGAALRFGDLGDEAQVTLPSGELRDAGTTAIVVEAMIYPLRFKAYNRKNVPILALQESWDAGLVLAEDAYTGLQVQGGVDWNVSGEILKGKLSVRQWHHVQLRLDQTGYSFVVNGELVASHPSGTLANWGRGGDAVLRFGNFEGWIDEVVVTSTGTTAVPVVKTPVITPNGGAVNGAATVTIESPTPKAIIRYTTDGSVPTEESDAYVAPLTMDRRTTLRARAFKTGMVTSAVASADFVIYAGDSGPTTANAVFVRRDELTQGAWPGVYGAEGYQIASHQAKLPSGVESSAIGAAPYTWAESTDDIRALSKVAIEDRVVSCWYSSEEMLFAIKLEGTTQRVSVYLVDWDRTGREQTIEVLDATTGMVLDSQRISRFEEGVYLTWDLSGHIHMRVRSDAGPNAVLMGIFFDGVSGSGTGETGSKVLAISRLPAGLNLRLTGSPGQSYVIEASSDMQTWSSIAVKTLVSETLEFTEFSDPEQPVRFYRARLVP